MITLFSIPKPFLGHTAIIQRNAIKSWLNVAGITEIILFGDDQGVAEAAAEFKLTHIPNIDKNEFGTPMLNSAFNVVQQDGHNLLVMYANADIILPHGFCELIKEIKLPQFVISGRRMDVDILSELDSLSCCEIEKLFRNAKSNGTLHGYAGMDYFIFPRGQISMPAFAVGRPGWDSWLIWKSKTSQIPVIDATEKMLVIHQNHDYSHSKYGKKKQVSGPEMYRNFRVAGGLANMMTLREADWLISASGHLVRPPWGRRCLSHLAQYKVWMKLLGGKRWVQRKILDSSW